MSIRETPRGSDDNLYSASTDSFWDVGNFKRTVKRIDDGAKLCDEFMKLVAERAEIEAKYALKLKAWSKKWEECIKSSAEYGTMEAAMRGSVTEAESRGEIHMHCRDKLIEEVHESIKKWKNDNYHKGIFQWKETKEADEGFTRAQKPWAKRLAKVERSKKAYHNAAKNVDQASKLESEASNDTEKSAGQLKKLQDATEKAKREMDKCGEKYELRLDEITTYNSQYEQDMIQEFERCQENEDKRLVFFRDVLSQYHKCLDISESPEFSGVFVNMSLTFQKADAPADLDWWSRNHGTGMPQNWPIFEDWKVPISNLQNRKELLKKHQADEQNEQLRHNLSTREPSTVKSLHKLEIHHLDLKCNQVRNSEMADSSDLINLNSDHSVQPVVLSSTDLNEKCGATFNRLVNNIEEIEDRTLSVDSVKNTHSSDTEAVYCEILDMTVRNEADSKCRLMKIQQSGSTSSPQASNVLSNSIDLIDKCGATVDSLVNSLGEIQDGTCSAVENSVERAPCSGKEVVYCEILDMAVKGEVDNECRSKEIQQLGSKSSTQTCIGLVDRQTGSDKEYNEIPTKRPSTSRSHEQAPAYSGTQNHINDNTDYSHQNEIVQSNQFNNFTSTTNEDFSDPATPDEWEIEPPPVEDAGIPVRALYDFQGMEDDELNFKEGDVLTQLSSQDDQGWCQGRYQGKVGHFPGTYVEPL